MCSNMGCKPNFVYNTDISRSSEVLLLTGKLCVSTLCLVYLFTLSANTDLHWLHTNYTSTQSQQISSSQRSDHTYQAIRSTITRNCRAEPWQAGHTTMFVIVRSFIVDRS
jgi:hypothetical protein